MEKLLIGIHTSLAFMTGVPSLALDTRTDEFDGKNEAQYLAKSIKDVSAHYSVSWVDQKTLDWFNLCQCLAMVYGSRVATAVMMKRASRPVKAPVERAMMPDAPPAQQHHDIQVGPAGPTPQEMRTASIPGVPGGDVIFPPDHPLAPKGKAN